MKLQKKLLGLALLATLSLSIVGCTSSKANDDDQTEIEAPIEDEIEGEEDEELEDEGEVDEIDPEEEIEIEEEEEIIEEETPQTPPSEDKPVENPPVEDKPEETPPTEDKPDETPDAPSMSASEVLDKAMAGIEPGGVQAPMDDAMLDDTYGIDRSLLNSYHVNAPMMIVKANEVAVFEVKDAADVDTVVAGINRRVESLKATWESYLVDQYELVVNHKIVTKGNYVIFVIDEQADAIINNFNNAVQ